MSRYTYQTYTNTALNATGIASAVAYSGGGYALSASGAGDNLAHQITFTGIAATNHSAKTVTVTGTDANGNAQTDTMAGPNGAVAVTTTKYFKTVTAVTISSTTGADTFNIGWNANAVGAYIYPETDRVPVINIEVFCRVASGSPTYSLQYTADRTPAGLAEGTNGSWLTHSTISAKTVTFDGQVTAPVEGLRLYFTAAGQVNMTVIEPFRAG